MGTLRNLILVVLDGLRPDHLGFHGYARRASPWLDEKSKEGVVFEQAICHSNWTLPSFNSILASQYPACHGVFRPSDRLALHDPTLAECLRTAGFRTGAFVGGTFLDPQFGLDRGFEVYRAGKNTSFRDFKDTLPLAVEWIRRRRGERYFALIHHNDLHPPFDVADRLPETIDHPFGDRTSPLDAMTPDYFFVRVYNRYPWSDVWGPAPTGEYRAAVEAIRSDPAELSHLIAHYDAQLLAADGQLRSMWAALESEGALEDTLVILTSDHGTELGERGLIGSCFHESLWDTVIRVPLVLWAPAIRPGRSRRVVEHVDVAPTALGALGVPIPRSFQGRVLPGTMHDVGGDGSQEEAFSAASALTPMDRMRLFSLRSERWKYLFDASTGEERLFDLRQDPGETHDIVERFPEVAGGFRARMAERLRSYSLAHV